jgi:tetratricopeptide (TPR) repeat protein
MVRFPRNSYAGKNTAAARPRGTFAAGFRIDGGGSLLTVKTSLTMAHQTLETARELQRSGDAKGALELARAVAAKHPDSPHAWWLIGLSAKSIGAYDEALTAFKETLRRVPEWAPGWTEYGAVLRTSGRVEEAKRALNHALTLDPRSASAHRELGLIFESSKVHDEQIKHLNAVDALGEATEADLNKLGTVYYNTKCYSSAAVSYRRASNLGHHAYSYFNLGLAYEYKENPQNLDAIDSYRRALRQDPNFKRAEEGICRLKTRLLPVADNLVRQGSRLLNPEEHYRFYSNPFELLRIQRGENVDKVDRSSLRKRKRVLLSEIELEDGQVPWLAGLRIDRSSASALVDELDDDDGWYRHQVVFDDQPLLNFLTRGEIDLFTYSDSYLPETTQNALDEEAFRSWITTPFCKQFDLVLTQALKHKVLIAVQAMLTGRRYVVESDDEACFIGAQKAADNLLQPLREELHRSAKVVPAVQSVEVISAELATILNLLPNNFHRCQTEAVRLIHSIAIACYNTHGESELSRQILATTRRFRFNSADLKQQLDKDSRTVDKIIARERKDEVKLIQAGKPLEITKDSVAQGDKVIPATEIASVRWGSILTGHGNARRLDVLLAFRSERGDVIEITWSATQDLQQQKKYFHNLVNAAFTYVLPHVLEKLRRQIESGERLTIGPVVVGRLGVQIEAKGWFSSKPMLVPWSQLETGIQNGLLRVCDRRSPKLQAVLDLRNVENAVILSLLVEAEGGPR